MVNNETDVVPIPMNPSLLTKKRDEEAELMLNVLLAVALLRVNVDEVAVTPKSKPPEVLLTSNMLVLNVGAAS